MKKTNIRKLYYHVRHRYLTMNNIVIAVALVIGIGWAWGSIGVMQRNYGLQKEIDEKNSEEKLAELETQNLKYEQKYYKALNTRNSRFASTLALEIQEKKYSSFRLILKQL